MVFLKTVMLTVERRKDAHPGWLICSLRILFFRGRAYALFLPFANVSLSFSLGTYVHVLITVGLVEDRSTSDSPSGNHLLDSDDYCVRHSWSCVVFRCLVFSLASPCLRMAHSCLPCSHVCGCEWNPPLYIDPFGICCCILRERRVVSFYRCFVPVRRASCFFCGLDLFSSILFVLGEEFGFSAGHCMTVLASRCNKNYSYPGKNYDNHPWIFLPDDDSLGSSLLNTYA